MRGVPRPPTIALLAMFATVVILTQRVAAEKGGRLFTFGVVADVQYADKDAAGARHYRESLDNLEECVAELNRHDLAFTIELGDIIDGNVTPEKTLSDLDTITGVYDRLEMPKYFVVGNHCLNAGKESLREKLSRESFYYDFRVPEAGGFRFVVLDGNDAGYGVLGEKQLEWLRDTLADALANDQRVILFNHFALLEAAAAHHRMREPGPVLDAMDEAGCVIAYFAGHDHAGGYAERNGVHNVTVKGMVEAPEKNAYAVIEVYPDKLKEIGFGAEPLRVMPLEQKKSVSEPAE
jgi:3',5'-cyclic AMP phosphodiesterase CpdA